MIYVAQMETEHFSFTALGETETKAIAALKRGWRTHIEQYSDGSRAGLFSANEAVEKYAAVTFPLDVGACARDYEPLPS